MPEEVDVSGAGETSLTLSALHEAWYQDVIPADMASALKKGAAWYADRAEGRLQWMLSGRDLYVLGPRDELSGYVSAPRWSWETSTPYSALPNCVSRCLP